jgi:predicted HD phosphohydrolase
MGALSSRPPAETDREWAFQWLTPDERSLWEQMSVADRRHSLLVARRFAQLRPRATRPELAGALLHDVGKIASGLGTWARVAATVVGPRGARFRAYHDHEAIGARLLAEHGSDAATIELCRGEGPAFADLQRADNF